VHKRIVLAIKSALSMGKRGVVSFVVIRHKADSNWALKVVASQGYCHLITPIEVVGMSVGRFYGEVLRVEKTRHTIMFSSQRKEEDKIYG
jgi:hypothetical protein